MKKGRGSMESNAPTGIRKSMLTAINNEGGLTIKALQGILAKEKIAADKVSPNVRYAVNDGLLKSELDQQDGKQVVMYVLTPAGHNWITTGGKKVEKVVAPKTKSRAKVEAKPVKPEVKQVKVEAKLVKPKAKSIKPKAKPAQKMAIDEILNSGAQFYLVEEGAKLVLADLRASKSFPSLGIATAEASRLVGAGGTGSSKLVVIQVHALVSPAMTSIVQPNPLAKQ